MTTVKCGDFSCRYYSSGECTAKVIALEVTGVEKRNGIKRYHIECKKYEPTYSYIEYCEAKDDDI